MSSVVRSDLTRPEAARRTAGVSGRTRNPGRLALAVLLVVGGGLVFVSLYRSHGRQVPVLVMARDVAAGQPIVDADLGLADVSASGVEMIPASERATVSTGKVAQVSLRKGSLLVRGQLGTTAPGAAGTGLVVVTLPADSVPAGMRAEMPVRVVSGTATYDATVQDVRAPGASTSNYAVTVRMTVEEAALVAVARDVRLVLLPASAATSTTATSTTATSTTATSTTATSTTATSTTVAPGTKSSSGSATSVARVATSRPPTTVAVNTTTVATVAQPVAVQPVAVQPVAVQPAADEEAA
jgi:hypothetical protein